jgi:uncharacterized surface protein with fasciclin (FAS1) repeats
MTLFSKAVLGSAAITALALGACSKQTDLAQDTGRTADQVAANTPSAVSAPPDTTAPVSSEPVSSDMTNKTIADVAASNSQFSTLFTAAKAAGLEDELASPGPITVFAPTDAAFAALPPGKLDDLMKPENKAQLEALLKHHIVSGKVTSTDLRGTSTETAMNGTLAIDGSNPDAMKVADATVVGPDITTSNGVIHPVDKVLIPAT